MSPRGRVRLAVVWMVALAAGAAIFGGCSNDRGPAAKVTDLSGATGPTSAFKGAVRPPGARAPNFSLLDQDGRRVTLRKLRGKVVALSPMYTTCTTTCPLIAQQIRAALEDLSPRDRRQIVALALSVDPPRDTPRRARHFLASRHVGHYLDFLLGSSRQLRPIWRGYGFSRQGVKQEHNSYVVLIDRRGMQRVGFAVGFLTPESLAHDLRLLVAGS